MLKYLSRKLLTEKYELPQSSKQASEQASEKKQKIAWAKAKAQVLTSPVTIHSFICTAYSHKPS